MGTINKPGKFDCAAKLHPDEPNFLLCGRDRLAASIVSLWAIARQALNEDPEKVAEAQDVENAMRHWLFLLKKKETNLLTVLPSELFLDELGRRGYDISAARQQHALMPWVTASTTADAAPSSSEPST